MTAQLIGLGGKLRSGKDAVADFLVAEKGYVKMGMSDALSDALLAMDPLIYSYTDNYGNPSEDRYSTVLAQEGYVEAKKIPEVRRLLQKLGTEVGREMIGENVWVDIMANKIDRHMAHGRNVVVTGIRFPNEVTLIRELGGLAVWTDRPSEVAAAGAAAHASEAGVSQEDFDIAIVNDGTLEDLYAKVIRDL